MVSCGNGASGGRCALFADARLVVGGEARNADVELGNGVAEEGMLDQVGFLRAPLSNILHTKLNNMWNAMLSCEGSRKSGTLEEDRMPHGGWEERWMRISCRVSVCRISGWCWDSIFVAVLAALLQMHLHVVV